MLEQPAKPTMHADNNSAGSLRSLTDYRPVYDIKECCLPSILLDLQVFYEPAQIGFLQA